MQRPRRLRLAAARRQVRLERLEQRPVPRRPALEQRAELLVDERVELRRVAEVVQQVGDPGAPGVVPAAWRQRGRGAGRAAHAPQALPGGRPRLDGRADRQRRYLDAGAAALEHGVEQPGDVLGERVVVAAAAEREEH